MYLFTEQGFSLLRSWRLAHKLYVFDFDGVLAPIVSKPSMARMREGTAHSIERLSKRAQVGIISGRSLDELKRLVPFEDLLLVGNHGLEGFPVGEAQKNALKVCASWVPQIEAAMGDWPETMSGVLVENKRYSLAIHYRSCRQKKQARLAISEILSSLDPLPRIVGGKCVVNVMPQNGLHKGTAFLELLARTGEKAGFFIGDDETDEDVFALPGGDLFSIRVGYKASSRARFYIQNQFQIDRLLAYLIDFQP